MEQSINKEALSAVYRLSMGDHINLNNMTQTEIRMAFNKLMGNLWVLLNPEEATKYSVEITR